MPFRSGPGLRRRRSAPSTPICGASPWSPSGGRSLLRRSCYGRYGHHDISTCPCDVMCAVLQRVGSLGARLTVCFPIDSQFQSVSPSAGEACGTRRDRSEFVSPLDVRDRAVDERGPVQGAAPEDAAQLDVVSRRDREDRGSAVSRPDPCANLILAEVRVRGPQGGSAISWPIRFPFATVGWKCCVPVFWPCTSVQWEFTTKPLTPARTPLKPRVHRNTLKAIWRPPSIGRTWSRRVAVVAKGCIGTMRTALRGMPIGARRASTALTASVFGTTPILRRFAVSSMSVRKTPRMPNRLPMRACQVASCANPYVAGRIWTPPAGMRPAPKTAWIAWTAAIRSDGLVRYTIKVFP